MKLTLIPKTNNSFTNYLSGTNHYITEYLLMLLSLFGLVTSIVLMIFSICNLIVAGDVVGLSTASGLSAVVAFLVFGPLYYFLASRVRSQEILTPDVVLHKARNVFFVLASLSAFAWFSGFMIAGVYFLVSPLVVKNASYSNDFVDVFLPAVCAALAIGISYVSVAKTATSTFVRKFASLALLSGAILAIITLSIAIAKKNVKPILHSGENCTYANYNKDKCTYDEYQDFNKKQYPSLYDQTTPSNNYENYQ